MQVTKLPDRRYRVLFVCGHPVQYMSPLLQRMAQHPQLDISTVYCRLRGAKAGIDPEFGAKIQWDIPLLDGYPWVEIQQRNIPLDFRTEFGINSSFRAAQPAVDGAYIELRVLRHSLQQWRHVLHWVSANEKHPITAGRGISHLASGHGDVFLLCD